MSKFIKVVKSVERTFYSNLTGLYKTGINAVKIPNAEWKQIKIKTPASLIITDKEENKNTLYSAQLKFLTCEEFIDKDRYVWRVTLADGTAYLLGTDERPFATMSAQINMPDNFKDNQLIEVTVTYNSSYNIPFIL